MAYHDKNKILEKAKEVIVKHNLFFIEEIVAFLPISKPTFYEYFKVGSNEFNDLKELLDVNRTKVKKTLQKKWLESDAPALQMGLYKLLATDEERKALSTNYTTLEGGDNPIKVQTIEPINWVQSMGEVDDLDNEDKTD